MRTSEVIEGMNILLNYVDDPDKGYHVGAEHDQLYFYATDRPLLEDHFKRLVELGWFQPEASQTEVFVDYQPEDGWSAFV